jgi:hypothetical protein
MNCQLGASSRMKAKIFAQYNMDDNNIGGVFFSTCMDDNKF